MLFQPNIYSLLLVAVAVENLLLALIVGWRRRGQRGVEAFVITLLGVAIWSFTYSFEVGTPDLATKLIFIPIEYLGIVSVPVALTAFIAIYTGHDRYVTPRNLVLASIIPLLTLVFVSTNSYHGLYYRSISLDTTPVIPQFDPTYGPLFWVNWGYAYVLLVVSTFLLVRTAVRSVRVFRDQAVAMLLAAFTPWIGNALYIAGVGPFPGFDLTPFAFTITGLALGWSLLNLRLLDLVPDARDAVVESMDDAIVAIDMQNRIVDLNPAARRILGPAGDRAVGRTLAELMPEQQATIARFREVMQTHTELALRVDNAVRTYDLRISPIRDRRSRVTGRLIVLRDITSSKEAEQELAHAHNRALEALRVKSRILAIVSHDFRTPLSAITGYADMLKQGALGPVTDQQRATLDRIIASAYQLSGMVTELLDQAQLDSGTITLKIGPFDPAQFADAIRSTMAPKAAAKGLALDLRIAPDLPNPVRGDFARLAQVTGNLVDNALKFTERGGVTVSLRSFDAENWAIEVADTGPGIPADVLPQIFDPFWQADSTITRTKGGIGLGLAIVKQLTTMMHGRVEVDSTLDRGTCFRLILPLHPPTIFQMMKGAMPHEVRGTGH